MWKLNVKLMNLVITLAMEMQNAYSKLGFSRVTSMAKNGFNV
jgi:hypothetical protein